MDYKIRIRYQTGGSFSLKVTEDNIEAKWTDLEVVAYNLKSIKAHHEMYKEYVNHRNKNTVNELRKKYAKYNLFNSKETDCWTCLNTLLLKEDNGLMFQIGAFWEGHFETIYRAYTITELPSIEFE